MANELTTRNAPQFEISALSAKEKFLSMADEKKWVSEIEFALQILRSNPVLQKADTASIRNAIVNVAMTGTTLNPAMAQAYLVPRDGKCCLDFSYRGLLKIATDSGGVKAIQANVVYDFDEFEYEEGTDQRIHFKRSMTPPDDFIKNPNVAFWPHLVCAFSIATLSDGSKDYMILPAWKIKKVKDSSKAKSEYSPWQTWPEEMARKTIIKYHYKTLPQTDRMSNAVTILNEHEGIETEKQSRGNAEELMRRFRPKVEVQSSSDNQTDVTPRNDEPDDFSESTETYNELAEMLRDSGKTGDLEAINDAWALVNKQKDNITGEQYKALFAQQANIRKAIEARKKGVGNV